jgi:hypothetical protein
LRLLLLSGQFRNDLLERLRAQVLRERAEDGLQFRRLSQPHSAFPLLIGLLLRLGHFLPAQHIDEAALIPLLRPLQDVAKLPAGLTQRLHTHVVDGLLAGLLVIPLRQLTGKLRRDGGRA